MLPADGRAADGSAELMNRHLRGWLLTKLHQLSDDKSWIANTGDHDAHAQGTPVAVQIPPEALRVLGPASGPPAAELRDQAEPTYAGSAG